jgi:hypothetical protein
MPDCACATPACADWIAPCALSRSRSALAARVSEPKPDSLSREAAFASISAAASCARAPASCASASGRRARAVQARLGLRQRGQRVPGSISHITVPSSTKAPGAQRLGNDPAGGFGGHVTSRNASVRPRRSTAFSAACASDRRAVTWTRVSVSSASAAVAGDVAGDRLCGIVGAESGGELHQRFAVENDEIERHADKGGDNDGKGFHAWLSTVRGNGPWHVPTFPDVLVSWIYAERTGSD